MNRSNNTGWNIGVKRRNQLLLCVLLTVLLMQSPQMAVCSSKNDSTLKASLIVVEPGTAIYSSLGHCALRLQSPQHGLDYCFTYEADAEDGIADYVRFFAAETKAHWVAVAAKEYFHDYATEHRRYAEYVLPLQQKEIQTLWRNLDEAMVSGRTDRFDFITNNCTQGLLRMLAQSVDSPLNLVEPRDIANLDNGDAARYVTRRSPWMQFWVVTLMGSQADGHWEAFNRATPEALPKMMHLNAVAGSSLPIANAKSLSVDVEDEHATGLLKPNVVFSLLLALSFLVFALDVKGKGRRVAEVYDGILFIFQAVAFLLLVWLTQISGLFVQEDASLFDHWNWYLLPLCPVPLALLIYQKLSKSKDTARRRVRRVYSVYSIWLLLFMAATPLSSQLDLTHQLITAAIAVRCASLSLFPLSLNQHFKTTKL